MTRSRCLAQGLEVTPAAARLESYLAVRNMYLSTFQALGGMGLLLGTLGLAVVLLRSVWERRGELALVRALGYRRGGGGGGGGGALEVLAPHPQPLSPAGRGGRVAPLPLGSGGAEWRPD